MTDVVMPQMGESIVEGTLTKWLKKPGERIERDEPLFEISTDKVDTEIPSPAAGTLSEILVEEGKTVGINTVVARIDEAGGAAAAKPAAAPARARRSPRAAAPRRPPQPRAAPPPAQRRSRRPSPRPSPPRKNRPARSLRWSARWRASSISILTQVKGTGAGGRITKQDVEAYVARAIAAGRRRRRPPRRPRRARRPGPGRARRAARHRAAAARRSGQDAHRADEHHAHQDRRAHGDVQAHLAARHHRPSRGYDQGGQDARAPQGAVPGQPTVSA